MEFGLKKLFIGFVGSLALLPFALEPSFGRGGTVQ